MSTLQMTIPDMACAVCVEKITKTVKSIDPNATIQTDLQTKKVQVETQAPDSQVKAAIAAAGYSIQP